MSVRPAAGAAGLATRTPERSVARVAGSTTETVPGGHLTPPAGAPPQAVLLAGAATDRADPLAGDPAGRTDLVPRSHQTVVGLAAAVDPAVALARTAPVRYARRSARTRPPPLAVRPTEAPGRTRQAPLAHPSDQGNPACRRAAPAYRAPEAAAAQATVRWAPRTRPARSGRPSATTNPAREHPVQPDPACPPDQTDPACTAAQTDPACPAARTGPACPAARTDPAD
jgi:hypothetical protein